MSYLAPLVLSSYLLFTIYFNYSCAYISGLQSVTFFKPEPQSPCSVIALQFSKISRGEIDAGSLPSTSEMSLTISLEKLELRCHGDATAARAGRLDPDLVIARPQNKKVIKHSNRRTRFFRAKLHRRERQPSPRQITSRF